MTKSCSTTNNKSNIDQLISASGLKITELNCDNDTISVKYAGANVTIPNDYILNYTPLPTVGTFSSSYCGALPPPSYHTGTDRRFCHT